MQLFFKSIKCIGKNNNKKKHLSRFRGKKENKRAMSTSQLSIYAPKIWSVVSQQSFEIHRKQSGDQVGLGHHQIMLSGCHESSATMKTRTLGFLLSRLINRMKR